MAGCQGPMRDCLGRNSSKVPQCRLGCGGPTTKKQRCANSAFDERRWNKIFASQWGSKLVATGVRSSRAKSRSLARNPPGVRKPTVIDIMLQGGGSGGRVPWCTSDRAYTGLKMKDRALEAS